ncbi:hypothetical protein HDZ31DRAFT_37384, partial [Schizophyllum fasciatum]
QTAWKDLEAAERDHCVNLNGRVALVTGAKREYASDPNAIGYHTALHLARSGAKVYVGARNRQRARQAIALMRESQTDKEMLLEPFVADLRDMQQVKTASDRLKAAESRLDIIINNAAISEDPEIKTEYGLATTMVVNYLSPFLLVLNLKPLLMSTAQSGGDVRIINMTSTVHTVIDGLNLDCYFSLNVDPQWVGPRSPALQQYALSKLALVMHVKTLQRHFDAQGIPILAMAVFPGFAKTTRTLKLMGDSPDMIFSPSDCAFTGLFAATEPSVRTSGRLDGADRQCGLSARGTNGEAGSTKTSGTYGGAYIVPFGVVGKSTATAEDEALGDKLWALSSRVVQDVLWML